MANASRPSAKGIAAHRWPLRKWVLPPPRTDEDWTPWVLTAAAVASRPNSEHAVQAQNLENASGLPVDVLDRERPAVFANPLEQGNQPTDPRTVDLVYRGEVDHDSGRARGNDFVE